MQAWFDKFWHGTLKRPYVLVARIDRGQGKPVIFLHGIAAKAENWLPVITLLDDTSHRSVALDVLGFGKSPRPEWLEYSVDDHARAVVHTLKKLKIRDPVILVGHSMGSLIAARIAAVKPDMVDHLILYQMPVYSELPIPSKRNNRRIKMYLSIYKRMAENPKLTLRYAELMGRYAAKAVGFRLDQATWTPFEMSLRNTIMQQQIYDDLKRITVQTDVVYGRLDMFVMRSDVQQLFKKSPYIRFYEINELHRISGRSAPLLGRLIKRKKSETDHTSSANKPI